MQFAWYAPDGRSWRKVPRLADGAPVPARLQDDAARVAELAGRHWVGRLVRDEHRPVVAGDAVGRGVKVRCTRRVARLARRVLRQDEAVLPPLAPIALVDQDVEGDRFARRDTTAAVADKPKLAPLAPRKRQAPSAVCVARSAQHPVKEVPLEAAPAAPVLYVETVRLGDAQPTRTQRKARTTRRAERRGVAVFGGEMVFKFVSPSLKTISYWLVQPPC